MMVLLLQRYGLNVCTFSMFHLGKVFYLMSVIMRTYWDVTTLRVYEMGIKAHQSQFLCIKIVRKNKPQSKRVTHLTSSFS